MKKKKRKSGISIPIIAMLAVCSIVLVFSIWQLLEVYLEYKKGTDEYEGLLQYIAEEVPGDSYGEGSAESDTLEEGETGEESGIGKPEGMSRVGLEELKAVNEDTAGWIEIPGTHISYPLMHTEDDVYYLNHTFRRNVNSAGSIFIETLNAPDFTDLHTIIYGHNMKNGSMFAGLKNYASVAYLLEHPTIYVDLEDGTHAYQIFSCYETSPDSDSYTIGFAPDEQYEAFLQKLKSRSAYDTGVEVAVTDSIISLSTCAGNGENRYLVHEKKIY